MPGSLLSGAFKFVDSMGTAIHYEGCFLDKPGCPIPHGPGIRREKNAVSAAEEFTRLLVLFSFFEIYFKAPPHCQSHTDEIGTIFWSRSVNSN